MYARLGPETYGYAAFRKYAGDVRSGGGMPPLGTLPFFILQIGYAAGLEKHGVAHLSMSARGETYFHKAVRNPYRVKARESN